MNIYSEGMTSTSFRVASFNICLKLGTGEHLLRQLLKLGFDHIGLLHFIKGRIDVADQELGKERPGIGVEM